MSANSFWKFFKGIVIRPETSDPSTTDAGSMWYNSTDGKFKGYVNGASREVVTNSDTQVLTNKSIDADTNPITNIENADIKVGAAIAVDKLQALTNDRAVFTDATGKIRAATTTAAELDLLSGVTSSVQTQLNSNATGLSAHINTALDAHDASAISFIPAGTIAATEVQAAVAEVATDAAAALALHEADTTNIHGITDTSLLVTTVGIQTLTNKTLTAPVINSPTGLVKGDVSLGNVDNTSDATKNAALATLTNKTIVAANNTITTAASGNLVATEINAALSELQTDIDTRATAGALAAHEADTTAIHGIVDTSLLVTTTGTQVLTNKDIDGATASNTSRITLPKASTATLNGLTRKQATLVYDTTLNTVVVDDGVTLSTIGGGGSGIFSDSVFTLQDNIDATKQLKFEASTISPATTRTLTSPDASGTLVLTDAAQTLSNKTLNNTNVVTVTDTNFTLQDNLDISKQVTFELSAINPATTRNLSFPNANGSIVLDSAIQTLSGKTISSPNITGITGTNDQSTPPAPAAGAYKTYIKTGSGRPHYLNEFGIEVSAGTGTGRVNYMEFNPGALVATTGYVASRNTVDSATPDSGFNVGTTTILTFSRNTVNPGRQLSDFLFTKSGAISKLGNQIYYNLDTIAASHQGQVFDVTFDYKIASGTYADGDIRIYIWDVTNSVLIEPSNRDLKNTTIWTKNKGTFQTPTNSTNLRLVLHIASASAVDYSIQFDDFFVGPQSTIQGAFVSDPVAYAPIFTGFGTPTSVNVVSWREGAYLCAEGTFTTGTNTATEARISLGSGGISGNVTTVSTLPTISQVGRFNGGTASATSFGGGPVLAEASKTYVTLGTESSTQNGLTKRNGNAFFDTAVHSFYFRVPIQGWSSGVTYASDAGDGRVVAFRATGQPTGTITSTDSIAVWGSGSVVNDTHGTYNSSTGRYTISGPGFFRVSGRASINATYLAGNVAQVAIYKNNISTAVAIDKPPAITGTSQATVTDVISCIAGDILDIRVSSNGTAPTYGSVANESSFSIEKVQGPSAIAAAESVTGHVGGTTTTFSNVTATPIIFNTVTFDSHGTYNSTTGEVTIPVSGKYNFTGSIYINSFAAGAVAQQLQINFDKAGAGEFGVYADAARTTTACSHVVQTSTILTLNAGDKIRTIGYQSMGGTPTIQNTAQYTYMTWNRVGN